MRFLSRHLRGPFAAAPDPSGSHQFPRCDHVQQYHRRTLICPDPMPSPYGGVGCGHGAAARPGMRDALQWTRWRAPRCRRWAFPPPDAGHDRRDPEERTTAAACPAAAGHVSGQYVAGPRVTVTDEPRLLATVRLHELRAPHVRCRDRSAPDPSSAVLKFGWFEIGALPVEVTDTDQSALGRDDRAEHVDAQLRADLRALAGAAHQSASGFRRPVPGHRPGPWRSLSQPGPDDP